MDKVFNRKKYCFLISATGFFTNILLAAAKITVGLMSGSVAVLADGVNNFSDGASSAISLVSFKMSERPADKKHPFGHARYEYVAGLVIAVVIIAVAIELFISSVRKIIDATGIDTSNLMIITLSVSIFVKFLLLMFYKTANKSAKSPAIRASVMDSLNDIVVTTVILIAALVTKYTGVVLDGWAGVAMALFVALSGVKTLKDALSPVIGEEAPDEFVAEIKTLVLSYDGIRGIHELVAHNYGPNKYHLSLHVEIDGDINVLDAHAIVDKIEIALEEKFALDAVIHIDPTNA